ncbi:MAG: DNA repair protein RecN [Acidimicrobiales bacterium]
MLAEIRVRDLGVLAELSLVLSDGMTALTGETGAGKTLLVEAIELLVGERADPVLVRPGADEARVEGRFVRGETETVLARVVPRDGRSRAYVDGRLATATELGELGRDLVDLHGQHTHQSLLSPSVQRDALDRFAGVDLGPLASARARLGDVQRALESIGGDERTRSREIGLLRFQVAELAAAELVAADEEELLEAEEDVLADALAHREAAADAFEALAADFGSAAHGLGRAVAAVAGRRPFAELEPRLRVLAVEVDEAATELRRAGEEIVDDPERLEAVRSRRRRLRELCRKYGEELSDVLAYEAETRARLAELESHDGRVAELERQRAAAEVELAVEGGRVAGAREAGAPELASAVEAHLRQLALGRARFEVAVDGTEGEKVQFLLGANPGEPALPLAKAASGGELARAMLAVRLVLTEAPPTLVFDEVDAGVGGEAALAVGRSLAALSGTHQVLVVTHLPQVAAFADHQVTVTKDTHDGRTVASARAVTGADRVIELSRMLSGQPSSSTARDHAAELLDVAAAARRREP